jgi:hypothetical protein
VICDFANNLSDDRLEEIRGLETDLGIVVVAFACRTFDPEREERLRKTMAALGPLLVAEPSDVDATQLARIRETEERLGLALVAVRA